MMNRIIASIKFAFVFTCIVSCYIYFYCKNNKADFERLAFSDQKIDMYCGQLRNNYQHCLNKSIHRLVTISTPMQITKISKLIIHVYEIEKIRHPQNQLGVLLDFLQNYTTFIDHIAEFSFHRNQLDFFQVILFPYYRFLISQDFKKVQSIIKNIDYQIIVDKQGGELKKYIEYLNTLNIGIFKDVI